MKFVYEPPVPSPGKPGETSFELTVGDKVCIVDITGENPFTGAHGVVRAFDSLAVGVGINPKSPPNCALWFDPGDVQRALQQTTQTERV
jgi:hypothetical protein